MGSERRKHCFFANQIVISDIYSPMYKVFRPLLPAAFLLLLVNTAIGQNPVKWSFTTKDAGNCQVDLILTGAIDDGWYSYSQFLESDEGPVATQLTFDQKAHFKLLGKAKESGDYRSAVRFEFLGTLKKLNDQSLIYFSMDKTNNDYFNELPETMQLPFLHLKSSYEITWYGNTNPGLTAYETIENQFQNFNQKIQP